MQRAIPPEQQQEQDLLVKLKIKVPPAIDCEPVRAYLRSRARNSKDSADNCKDSLVTMQKFLDKRYPGLDLGRSLSIILAAQQSKLEVPHSVLPWSDIYKLMDQYVGYLVDYGYSGQVPATFASRVKGFYEFNDVDISRSKFKNRVTIPKDRKEDAYPLSRDQIRQILLTMTNKRLKAFCTAEACIGARPTENAAVRYRDVAWDLDIPSVYMQAKYSKNKLPRVIYWSEEAKKLAWQLKVQKYDYSKPDPDDLVFGIKGADPADIYDAVAADFRHHLKTIGLDKRIEGLAGRHEITLYSFRRYAETTIEDHTSANFADYILGHKKSPYYNHAEPERRKIYLEKCAAHLVFFDYQAVERRAQAAEAEVHKVSFLLEQNMRWQNEWAGAIDVIKQLAKEAKERDKKIHELEARLAGKPQVPPAD